MQAVIENPRYIVSMDDPENERFLGVEIRQDRVRTAPFRAPLYLPLIITEGRAIRDWRQAQPPELIEPHAL
jgi:hypothetical protein